MKQFICSLTIASIVTTSAFAQGVFSFSNRDLGRGVDAPVFLYVNSDIKLESAFVAQLWGGADEASLAPVSSVSAFRDGTGAGYWNAPLSERTEGVAIPGVAPGEVATLRVFAWEADYATLEEAQANLGLWNGSGLFTATAGSPPLAGPPAVPASPNALTGLQSFHIIVPEPTSIALAGLGMLALSWRLRNRRA